MYLDDEGREWVVVVMCEERETILKNQEKLMYIEDDGYSVFMYLEDEGRK